MEPQLDGSIIVASLLILSVLISSAALWVQQVQRPRAQKIPDAGISPWNIGWVNFGIFLCAIIFLVFLSQSVGAILLFPGSSDGPAELTSWLAVAAVLLLQVPMLAVFYGSRRFYPDLYGSKLSEHKLPLFQAAKNAFIYFIMLLPVVWLVTLVWSNLLLHLENIGLIQSVEPQPIVTLFTDGRDPVAIGFLVIMAVVLAPVVEEIIFRGCVYRFLKSQTSLIAAQIISSALFALLHTNLLSFVPLMVVGILLARIYEKSGNLGVAIWFHAFFNGFSLSMLLITSFSDKL